MSFRKQSSVVQDARQAAVDDDSEVDEKLFSTQVDGDRSWG
jgi:hypothetical protein